MLYDLGFKWHTSLQVNMAPKTLLILVVLGGLILAIYVYLNSVSPDKRQPLYFNDYPCTDDCSGHEAGYNWAEEKGIGDVGDCGGNSQSFIEGCWSYVEENYLESEDSGYDY